MGRGAKGAGGGGSPAAPLFAQRLDALQAQVNAQQAKLDETHRLVSNNGEGLKAVLEEMKLYFDEARDAVDNALADARKEIDQKLRRMDGVIEKNGEQFKLNAAKYRERAEEAFAEARKAQENQARETARFKQTVQDLATLDKHVTSCFRTAMQRNDELRDELQDAARDYANVHNQLETLKEQVAHLQKGLREKDAMSRRNLKAKVIELSGEFESMRGAVHNFAYNMAGDGNEGQESGGVNVPSVKDNIERGQRAATLLRARAESAPPASGRHHQYVAAAAEKSGATGSRPYIQSVQASADQVFPVAPFPPPVFVASPSTPPAGFHLCVVAAAPDLSDAPDCNRLEVGGCDFCMGGMGVGGEGRVGAIGGEVVPPQPTADKKPPPPLVLPPFLPSASPCPPPHEEPHMGKPKPTVSLPLKKAVTWEGRSNDMMSRALQTGTSCACRRRLREGNSSVCSAAPGGRLI